MTLKHAALFGSAWAERSLVHNGLPLVTRNAPSVASGIGRNVHIYLPPMLMRHEPLPRCRVRLAVDCAESMTSNMVTTNHLSSTVYRSPAALQRSPSGRACGRRIGAVNDRPRGSDHVPVECRSRIGCCLVASVIVELYDHV